MTLVIGIDPGLGGAIACVSKETLWWIEDMPVVGDEVSVPQLHRLYNEDLMGPWQIQSDTPIGIEQLKPNGKNGSIANFKLGFAYGMVIAFFAGRGHRVTRHSPAEWKKTFGLYGIGRDEAKEAARRKAIELWPDMADKFRYKKDADRAEAALIALHLSRQLARDAGGVEEYQAEIRRLHAELDAVRGGDAA